MATEIHFATDDEYPCSAKLRRRGWDGWECERVMGHSGAHAVPEMALAPTSWALRALTTRTES